MLHFATRLFAVFLTMTQILSVQSAFAQSQDITPRQEAPASQNDDQSQVSTASDDANAVSLAEEFDLPARVLDPLIDKELLELFLLPLTEEQLASPNAAYTSKVALPYRQIRRKNEACFVSAGSSMIHFG